MARHVVRGSLSDAAKRDLNRAAEEMGMKNQELYGRLLEWFVNQDRMVQLIAVGQIPPSWEGDIIDLLFRRRQAQRAAEKKGLAVGDAIAQDAIQDAYLVRGLQPPSKEEATR